MMAVICLLLIVCIACTIAFLVILFLENYDKDGVDPQEIDLTDYSEADEENYRI